jgi:hypothetical protein
MDVSSRLGRWVLPSQAKGPTSEAEPFLGFDGSEEGARRQCGHAFVVCDKDRSRRELLKERAT